MSGDGWSAMRKSGHRFSVHRATNEEIQGVSSSIGYWMPDAELDSTKGPGMAGGYEAEKLLFVGTSERP